MQPLPFKLFLGFIAAFAATSAFAESQNSSHEPSRIAPEASFSHFWDGFSLGLGLSSERLSDESATLYKPYQPGFQLTISQHIRSVFSGSLSLRAAYWEQNAQSTNNNQTLIPLTITTQVEVTLPRNDFLSEPFGTTVLPYAFVGPGGIFFTSNTERELPGRSYVLEAGAGITFLTGRRTSLRIAHRFWKSAASLNLKGSISSIELHVGDFTNTLSR
jgi:hypothetical protein